MPIEEALKHIILEHGLQICKRTSSFEALLLDYCGVGREKYKKEVRALVSFCREGCSLELLKLEEPLDLTKNKWVHKLEENLGITRQLAEWTVSSWMNAAKPELAKWKAVKDGSLFNGIYPMTLPEVKQRAGEMAIGAYVMFGTYRQEPILWRVVTQAKGVMLMSHRILCLKPFDAAESGSRGLAGEDACKDKGQQQFGSNVWAFSNLREWLNSAQSSVQFSTYPPTEQAVWGGYNAYDEEPGFLHAFTQAELDAIQPVFHEDVMDRVYLPSVEELSQLQEKRKKASPQAVQHSDYTFRELIAGGYWSYWTRTGSPVATYLVHNVLRDGSIQTYIANRGDEGVVPCIHLKAHLSIRNSGTYADPHVLVNE